MRIDNAQLAYELARREWRYYPPHLSVILFYMMILIYFTYMFVFIRFILRKHCLTSRILPCIN